MGTTADHREQRDLTPEEVAEKVREREREEELDALSATWSRRVGAPMLLGGALTGFMLVLRTEPVNVTEAGMVMFMTLCGGILLRERTFRGIMERFIDALPGGKR